MERHMAGNFLIFLRIGLFHHFENHSNMLFVNLQCSTCKRDKVQPYYFYLIALDTEQAMQVRNVNKYS